MKILQPISNTDFHEITQFFGNMWKEEFSLDRFDRINDYKNGNVYFIRNNNQIVSAITLVRFKDENYIGRFGTLKEFRGNGYGTYLINHLLDSLKQSGEKEVFLDADFKRTALYEKFGFTQIGEKKEVGNTYGIKMKKIL